MAMPPIGGVVGKFRSKLRQRLGMEYPQPQRQGDARLPWDYPSSGGTQLSWSRSSGKESTIQSSSAG
jgi:hypothetical protein